ncbi:MAG: hypothetical protein L3J56_03805 [Bacteroidales bacterium]|nr:hypothetical protein [Bacteroidales bacterium]
MENTVVNNLLDNRFAVTYLQANEIIDSFWDNLKISAKKVRAESKGMSFTIVYRVFNYGQIVIYSERGYMKYDLKMKEKEVDLLKYEPLLKNIQVTSKKNIIFLLSTIVNYIKDLKTDNTTT